MRHIGYNFVISTQLILFRMFSNGGCNSHSHGVVVCRLQPYSICHQGLSGALRSRGPSESLGAWAGFAALRGTNPSLETKAWRLGWVPLLCAELTQASRQVSVKSLRTQSGTVQFAYGLGCVCNGSLVCRCWCERNRPWTLMVYSKWSLMVVFVHATACAGDRPLESRT
jgi:hypothetical protein